MNAAGDVVLAADAWGAFRQGLVSFVARRVKSREDADDIVQQVFLNLHRRRESVRRGEAVGAWLHRAARNAIADYYRAPRRRREQAAGDTRELDVRPAAGHPESSEASAAAERECASACLGPLLDRLGEADRRSIHSVEIEGRSQAEAARLEGLSLSGMKSRVQRARRRLKDLLLERCRIRLDARGRVAGCDAMGDVCRARTN
jgi:RNA polymerase sigma-70 factor (ECF subfamily)